MNRGQLGLGGIAQAGIGFAIVIIIVFAVSLTVTNTYLTAAANVTPTGNLTGTARDVAQLTPLFIVMSLIFIPLSAYAIKQFG